MRRIVTGVDSEGRSTVARIDEVDDMEVWSAATADTPPWLTASSGSMPFEPAPGYVKCMALAIPPDLDRRADEKQGDGPVDGLHQTRSIDLIFAREPLVLVLETGEIAIDAGDVVIQQGTMHDWRNPGTNPAQIIGFSWGVDVRASR
jgi:hypothetical protein